jgi:hypothetical protein
VLLGAEPRTNINTITIMAVVITIVDLALLNLSQL